MNSTLMSTDNAKQIISSLTQVQRDTLESSHRRYLAFAYVLLDKELAEQAEKDRQSYPDLLHFNEDRQSIVSGQRAATFMGAVTGLPFEWCRAWDSHQFHETYGTKLEEVEQAENI